MGVSVEGARRHDVAGLEQAREGIVVDQHGAAEAAADAAQILHIVLHVRAHRLRPARRTSSHAAMTKKASRSRSLAEEEYLCGATPHKISQCI